MKASSYGRIVLGLSAVLFGVISLMWHDADTWQSLRHMWDLPAGTFVGIAFMIAQIAGGLGLLIPQTLRPASLVLIVVYAVFSLACLPSIFGHPTMYVAYGSFFEQFALLSGSLAVYASTETDAARALSFGRMARIGLGMSTISFTLAQVFYLKLTADLVPAWIVPNQMFWAILTTVAFGLAAIAILINVQARLATRLLALMIMLFGIVVWIPLLIAHPESHGNWSEFALTVLIAGAAGCVAELDAF